MIWNFVAFKKNIYFDKNLKLKLLLCNTENEPILPVTENYRFKGCQTKPSMAQNKSLIKLKESRFGKTSSYSSTTTFLSQEELDMKDTILAELYVSHIAQRQTVKSEYTVKR